MKNYQDILIEEEIDIFFQNQSIFESIMSEINFEIPPRGEGHQNYHIENYIFFTWLKWMNDNNLLKYPFSILKTEKPDFVITYNNKTEIGIEITKLLTRILKSI